ncbi:TIGR01244 family sulfur transferase [Vibrio albus]|jgi:sulfide:quinone oxidoreductase|nr:TIGR01244 family sulfur transferase [Vibrio albus]
MLEIKQLTDDFAVSPQISPGDVHKIAELGFKTIINNRPDNEEPFQPFNLDIENQANELGLTYIHQPVGHLTAEDAAQFGEILKQAPRPLLAFCRSGTRCSILWVVGSDDLTSMENRIARARDCGYSLG